MSPPPALSRVLGRLRRPASGSRRGLAVAASAALVAGLAAAAVPLAASPAAAQATVPYTWNNVEIAGGGFVPNIVFNETEPNLIYARTDIGGMYRWNQSTQRWTPLLDWVSWDNWGWNGVESIATDPVDPDRVYAAVGMYTNDWDPNNGAIIRSSNRGQSWQVTELPFKVGGNMPGRGMGERLAVDPSNNNVVYYGAPNGNGLWRSTNAGATWSRVASFPNAGNWAQDPADPNGYLSHQPGVVWVSFDPRTGSANGTTQTIYVGVADLQNGVYRSTNGGSTWQRVAGQPTGLLAQKGALDEVNGHLYVTLSDNGGPYDGTTGAVWRLDTATGSWTDVTPPPPPGLGEEIWYGYAGLSLDRQDPGTLMVTGYSSWWPDTVIQRSTDSGATWTHFYGVTWPNRDNNYTLNTSASPWLSFGANPELPEQSPKLGWMTQGLAIDPHNSNRMMYGTGATVFGTTNLTALDSGGTVNLQVRAQGIEETAVLGLAKPPGGALLSALGDIGGFRHPSLTTAPSMMHDQPNFGSNTDIDFAALNPSWVVRVGQPVGEGVGGIAFSTNSGENWFAGTAPGNPTGGSVAAAADGQRFLWAPNGSAVLAVQGFGNNFTQASGVPAGAKVAADRVDPLRFYAYANGTFYVSTNGGTSFSATATNLPATGFVSVEAVPGQSGHVWVAGETGLFRSTNGGTSFTAVPGVTWGYNVAFGAPAPGQSHPAVYAVAEVGGVTGVFRSDDAGGSWVRINDDAHQWGNMGGALAADLDLYGRVYVGTNGRGIIYGSPAGGTTPPPNPPPPPNPQPPPPNPQPPPPNPQPPPPPPAGDCAVSYQVTNEWTGGFQADLVVTNTSGTTVNGWTLRWSYPAGQRIDQLWNGSWQQSGPDVAVSNTTWNGTLAATGGSASVGFLASTQGSNPVPSTFTLNGTTCAVS